MVTFNLQDVIHAPTPDYTPRNAKESWSQDNVRLLMSNNGGAGWRNNVGVAFRADGVPVRYGLANESKHMNSLLKSSDIIGITPIVITPEHIGRKLGIFTSVEVKKPGWEFRGTEREHAQLSWLALIISMGGMAGFSTGGL
jgi:hypothetical protein